MNKFWKIFTKEVFKPHPVLESIVYNVNSFNTWFCDPNNNAEYAHRGIYLRTDKLSMSHIEDYLKKCYGITEWSFERNYKFLNEVTKDWFSKL